MHLTQVGLRGVPRHARAVLHRLTLMGITRDAEPGQELNARLIRFAHGVRAAAADRRHEPTQHVRHRASSEGHRVITRFARGDREIGDSLSCSLSPYDTVTPSPTTRHPRLTPG